MSQSNLSPQEISQLTPEQCFTYFIENVVKHKEVWILTDEHGCVMLNTEDEDCVPVWPSSESAQAWATGDWVACQAEPITLKAWQLRWTPGLEEDGFCVVVFPIESQEGTVVEAQDLESDLRKEIKRQNKQK